ncbi:MAG: adenine methyltransferase [Rhizobacter sp.]|nr:adenine methyltransferase [Rhizobacter sp.]
MAKRPSGDWIINFGTRSEGEAALFEPVFEYAASHIKAERQKSKTLKNREQWWLFERARPEMFEAFGARPRYLATCLVAKHRFFVWQDRCVVPENVVIVVARSDDITFGILHSRFHELWSLRMCTFLGVGNDPRYTPTTCFETFPFPEGMTPKDTKLGAPDTPTAKTIEEAAKKLDELRNSWLNPAEWTDWVITPQEQAAGFPKRPVAKPGHESDLKTRTLTNLYNQRPTWLAIAHEALDKAVAAAYGWKDYSPQWTDEDILRRLLALNLERGTEQISAKG